MVGKVSKDKINYFEAEEKVVAAPKVRSTRVVDLEVWSCILKEW